MAFWSKFLKNDKGIVSVEIAAATPILAMMALSCVEITSYVLFSQKVDRAVTAMGDLTSQAKGLTAADVANFYDAAEYIMRPYDLDTNGSVIVTSVSTPAGGVATVNWQWNSNAAESQLGASGGPASLPAGFVVREGESVVFSEISVNYEPIVLDQFFNGEPHYQYSVFRPRFDALTSLD